MNETVQHISQNHDVYYSIAVAVITFIVGLHLPVPSFMRPFWDWILKHKTIIVTVGTDIVSAVEASGALKVARNGKVVDANSSEAKTTLMARRSVNPLMSSGTLATELETPTSLALTGTATINTVTGNDTIVKKPDWYDNKL